MTAEAVIGFYCASPNPIVEIRVMDQTPLSTLQSCHRATHHTLTSQGHCVSIGAIRKRFVILTLACLGISALGGCRICADCEDLDYPAYGGAWQRTLRDSGRVGSMFDPGGARASELVSRDDPVATDELERQRQESLGDATEESEDDMDSDIEDSESDDSSEDEEMDLDDLENRKLDDIELDREKELEEKSLDDIEVNIIPGRPIPPVLR